MPFLFWKEKEKRQFETIILKTVILICLQSDKDLAYNSENRSN